MKTPVFQPAFSVGAHGFEPWTSSLSGTRSNQTELRARRPTETISAHVGVILTESDANSRGFLHFLRIFVSARRRRKRFKNRVVESHVAIGGGEELDDVRGFRFRLTRRRGARRERLRKLKIAERTFRKTQVEVGASRREEKSRSESQTLVVSAFRKARETGKTAASAF